MKRIKAMKQSLTFLFLVIVAHLNLQRSLIETPGAKCRLNRVNLFIVGDSGAGKTSVLRWLRSRPFRAEHESTDMADIMTVDIKDWDEPKVDTLKAALTRAASEGKKESLKEQRDKAREKGKVEEEKISRKEERKKQETKDGMSANQSKNSLNVLQSLQFRSGDKYEEYYLSEEKMTYHVWDFGAYYHTHHIFFSSNSIYLVVVDVSREDYLERMTFWLHSIQGYYDQPDISNIVIIGTHVDQLSSEEASKREEKMKIRGRMEKISEMDVMTVSCRDGVNSNESLKQRLWKIAETMNRGKEYDARTVVLLNLLLTLGQERRT